MQLLRISFLTFSKAVSLAESLCTEMTVNRVLPTAISETVQGLPSYVPTAALISWGTVISPAEAVKYDMYPGPYT